ncbi:hypothetical protein [Paraburkholderia diazotrophica]|uniref:Uncharacterized protein n=1 Tax=Paraburkholderia diazotrophica TaxID=667676 RepID=A0A1H6V0B0_9BURK|nr:hypothetical protein [Paraburkholderia diazotrophica]SEI96364.1 hypothetical protein SAMN05192539_1005215 [Paraburkholderia diazotrophica]
MSDVQTTTAAPVETSSTGPDLASIASRLYRNAEPTLLDSNAQPAKPEQQPATTQQTSEAKPAEEKPAEATTTDAKSHIPDAIRELRDDPLRRMFGAQGTFAQVPLEEGMQNIGLQPDTVKAIATEFREVFADLGASPDDAKQLVIFAAQHNANMPVDNAADARLAASAADALVRQYGSEADSALRDAQRFVARDPRLGRMLDETRLGNDPQTVLKVVQLARSAKMRGELK